MKTAVNRVLCQYILSVSFSVSCEAVIMIFNGQKVHNSFFYSAQFHVWEGLREDYLFSLPVTDKCRAPSLLPSLPHSFCTLFSPSLSFCQNLPPPLPSLKNVEGPVIHMHAWLADDKVYIAACASVPCSATSVCYPCSRVFPVCPQPKTGSNVCYLEVTSWTNIWSGTDYNCPKGTSL